MMCDSDVIRIELETKVHEESLLKPNCPYLYCILLVNTCSV